MPEQIERAATQLLPQGQPDGAARARAAPHRRPRRGRRAAYRTDKSIERVWKTEDSLLCCIGPDPGDENVVRSAARLAGQLGVEWTAVYVETPCAATIAHARARAHPARGQARRTNSAPRPRSWRAPIPPRKSSSTRASTTARRCSSAAPSAPPGVRGSASVVQRIGELAPDIDLIEVGRTQVASRARRERPSPIRAGARSACAICGRSSPASVPRPWPRRWIRFFDLANIVMLFLLAVVGVALKWGRGPAVLAAFVSVAAFDFFFVPPRLSFAVSDVQYLADVCRHAGGGAGDRADDRQLALPGAGGVVSRRARPHAVRVRARHVEPPSDRRRGRGGDETDRQHLRRQGGDPGGGRRGSHPVGSRRRQGGPALDLGAAQWAYDKSQPAGIGTDTLAGNASLYLPLRAPMRTRGVLVLEPANARILLVPEQRRHLDTFAALTAIALERVHYVEVAQQALLHMESERLRNSLLAALSHDLRTPLAALQSASASR